MPNARKRLAASRNLASSYPADPAKRVRQRLDGQNARLFQRLRQDQRERGGVLTSMLVLKPGAATAAPGFFYPPPPGRYGLGAVPIAPPRQAMRPG